MPRPDWGNPLPKPLLESQYAALADTYKSEPTLDILAVWPRLPKQGYVTAEDVFLQWKGAELELFPEAPAITAAIVPPKLDVDLESKKSLKKPRSPEPEQPVETAQQQTEQKKQDTKKQDSKKEDKKAAQKDSTSTKKTVALAPTPSRPTEQPEQEPLDEKGLKALSQFEEFSLEWIDKINRNYQYKESTVEIVDQGGVFIARYYVVPPSTITVQVKRSKYDHTPFVGIMRYKEYVYESEGPTAEAAESGTYELVKQTKMTEIFRYAKNRWIY